LYKLKEATQSTIDTIEDKKRRQNDRNKARNEASVKVAREYIKDVEHFTDKIKK